MSEELTQEQIIINLQARLNLTANVLSEVAAILAQTQPDWIVDRLDELMREWSKMEQASPLPMDDGSIP